MSEDVTDIKDTETPEDEARRKALNKLVGEKIKDADISALYQARRTAEGDKAKAQQAFIAQLDRSDTTQLFGMFSKVCRKGAEKLPEHAKALTAMAEHVDETLKAGANPTALTKEMRYQFAAVQALGNGDEATKRPPLPADKTEPLMQVLSRIGVQLNS